MFKGETHGECERTLHAEELQAFCRFIGHSETVQTEWLKHLSRNHPEFELGDVLETAAGQTRKELAASMKDTARPESMRDSCDDVADVLDICRTGLEMSMDSMLGKEDASYAAVVGQALKARASSTYHGEQTANMKYGDQTFQV